MGGLMQAQQFRRMRLDKQMQIRKFPQALSAPQIGNTILNSRQTQLPPGYMKLDGLIPTVKQGQINAQALIRPRQPDGTARGGDEGVIIKRMLIHGDDGAIGELAKQPRAEMQQIAAHN